MRENPVLFDLAQLLEAGISPAEAAQRLLSGDAEGNSDLKNLARAFNSGRSIANALSTAGFATKLETEILRNAEHSGKISEVLRLVASNFEKRKLRTHALRMRLWLPNFVVFVALVVSVVRAVTAGATVGGSIIQAAFVAVVVIGTTQFILISTSRDASRWLSLGWSWHFQKSSQLFRRLFEQTFYTIFLWQTEAGVDQLSGARSLATVLDAPSYRRSTRRYAEDLKKGESVTSALQNAGLLIPGELASVINTGEQSGRLGHALKHYLDIQQASLEQLTNTIFSWIPRIYYLIVIIIVTGTMI